MRWDAAVPGITSILARRMNEVFHEVVVSQEMKPSIR
jgi:hypothetical protein